MSPFIISVRSVDTFIAELESNLNTASPTLCISYSEASFNFEAIASHLKLLNI